jgi:flagellar L-ring protein precursor FlgH
MTRRWIAAALLTFPSWAHAQTEPSADFGWLADGRRFRVGDVLTVVVDEFTTASADRATSALQDRTADAGASGFVNGRGGDGSLSTFLENRSTRRGRDVRQDRLASEVSVRVIAVEADGALRVEGTKLLVIDRHEQRVTVKGLVRPQDVSALNTIQSWRLADAEIRYEATGKLGEADKSLFMRLLGWIL